jgi:hypothetical protein
LRFGGPAVRFKGRAYKALVSTSTISVHCFQHPDITGASTLLRITY